MLVTTTGTAQDGGIPHAGCSCETCAEARVNPEKARRVASMFIDGEEGGYFVDTPPDFVRHLEFILARKKCSTGELIKGVFLTHAHLGHYTGILYFGKEALGLSGVKVFASNAMCAFLSGNLPFKRLVEDGNLSLVEMVPGEGVTIEPGLTAEIASVPHRNEIADTSAFAFRGPSASLLYLPDLDYWTDDASDAVNNAETALIDGTFFTDDELGPNQKNVPHPPISESIQRFAGTGTRVNFTHFNHTNPVLDEDSAEREIVIAAGFGLCSDGDTFEI